MSKTQIPTGGIADDAISEEHIDATVITGTTALAATPASTDEIIISDAGTLKRLDFAHIYNTPSFYAYLASNQTISSGSWTKLLIATESWDTDSAFASNKYTIPSGEGGKYHIGYSIATPATMDDGERLIGKLYVNGGAQNQTTSGEWSPAANTDLFINYSTIIDIDAGEYIELYGYQNDGSDVDIQATYTRLWGFKLIGV